MRYMNVGVTVLIPILGFIIGSFIRLGNGSAVLIGGFLGIILACLFFDWRKRNSETPSSLLLSRELRLSQEARKAEAENYMHGKFRG